ncbi:MAG: hypothetical protein AB7D43_09030 [Sulfurimonadaceae bacterium]
MFSIKNNKFIIVFLVILLGFVAFHSFTWHVFTSKLLDHNNDLMIGDLGRMSYKLTSLHPRKTESILEKKHFNATNWKSQSVDLITIGDSFSNGSGGGLNPYYQDYIATYFNINVLNLHNNTINFNQMDVVISLYNSGWLAHTKPKAILIEGVERMAKKTFAGTFNWEQNKFSLNDLLPNPSKNTLYKPNVHFINTGNYKFYYYQIKEHKNTIHLELNKSLFSVNSFHNQLLVYRDDIKNIIPANDVSVEKINKNLNKLASLLKTLDIELIYMPAVDKYDLYYDFIVNNPYPKNYFFDLLREQKKDYTFIDTKKILLEKLKGGERDIFYSDDTHWSHKASDMIAKNFGELNNGKL